MPQFRLFAPMIVLAAAQCVVVAEKTDDREYPAVIRIISHSTDDAGRRHIRLRLEIERDVAIYANPVRVPGMDHASARLDVFDAEGRPVKAKIVYPPGTKLETEFLGDYYLYRGSADIRVRLPDATPLPVTFRCRVAGVNERLFYCLGYGRLETTLANPERQEQPHATEPAAGSDSNGVVSPPAR